ncbi:hypothetical protein AB6A40_002032 [Gnathostoma spinigerum]|uniref:PDZ domain-containing protein n=1 Tax=Gnathostoma spinigerum TaxID=75299 RepID=A0ABD6E5L3_9BILA
MGSTAMVAPISSRSPGIYRANVSQGIRQVVLSRNRNGKYGLRLRSINKGIFVQFVADGSPAAAAGVRFGDQILRINDVEVVGMSHDKAMNLMTKSKDPDNLMITLRDRPFERAIVLHKDANGQLGFSHRDNLITGIMKESSASRNGLIINQRILEVDGRNVIGYNTKEVKACIDENPDSVTLTIMSAEMYDEMLRKMDWSLVKKQDHSIPDV